MPTQAQTYHQTHHVHGLPACPLCGWKSLIVRSFPAKPKDEASWGKFRVYYVTCENDGCMGTIEGPKAFSAAEAGKAFNTAMQKYSRSFQEGNDGVYDS